jgi:hypothetical protein
LGSLALLLPEVGNGARLSQTGEVSMEVSGK